jgi:ribosomal protein S6--L-glutamate ligase
VSRGARTSPFPVDQDWQQLALAAANAVGATLAGVDALPGRDGKLYVLEVNAVPGWQALARTLKQDVAALVLEHIESLVRNAAVDRKVS